MKRIYTTGFERDYRNLPESLQEVVDKQLILFCENPRHPSINLKKMKGYQNIWRGKVTGGYRFTVHIDGDVYVFRRVGSHDILDHP